MSHVPAAEAIGRLNKLKWANTTAKERLKILEQIQERIEEEMEDLGIEEAESKNMRIGTDDNPYAADACRLTAVVPVAFCISSAIDMYRVNIAGKMLNPVRVTKVEPNSGLDVIDFGSHKSEGEGENEAEAEAADESQSELEAADEKDEEEKNSVKETSKEEEEGEKNNYKESENGEAKLEAQDNGDQNQSPEKSSPEKPPREVVPTSPPAEQPAAPPPPPPSDLPPLPPMEEPLEPPTEVPPEPPTEVPPEPPKADEETEEKEADKDDDAVSKDDNTEESAEEENKVEAKENGDQNQTPEKTPPENPPPDIVPTSPPAEQPSDLPPPPPSDLPPLPPMEEPPKPPTEAPPEPPKADEESEENQDCAAGAVSKDDDDEDNGNNNNNQSIEKAQENGEKAKAEQEDKSIKITFDPDDEFAILAEKGKLPPVYFDALVSPRTWNEKGYFNARQERLRFQEFIQDPDGPESDPEGRVGPYDRRDPQATAILGSSCYSAAAEIIKATFLDGHVVVYKPHPYNANVDQIWAEILKPLVEIGAVSYCLADQGPELVQDPRIDQIYMTGSEETGQAILKTGKPCVLETGGVNPVILVPGLNRKWGVKEMRHHALQIASAGKFNGGHFCGRPQVIVTSKSWDQRDEFLVELEKAIAERTPPEGSYDPKYRKVFDRFVHEYPDGKVFTFAGLVTDAARVLLVTGASENSYGLKHEAFCQVLIEVALDIPDHPVAFLPEAVKFCNEKLYGSLCATIVIDDANNKKYSGYVQQALSDLNYGTVATNAMACFGWFNPGLYWGNYKSEDDDAQTKGVGHFGNLFGYQTAAKSVITDSFTGNGHWIKTCRGAYAEKILSLSYYALDPTWKKVSAYKYKGVRAAAARKDW